MFGSQTHGNLPVIFLRRRRKITMTMVFLQARASKRAAGCRKGSILLFFGSPSKPPRLIQATLRTTREIYFSETRGIDDSAIIYGHFLNSGYLKSGSIFQVRIGTRPRPVRPSLWYANSKNDFVRWKESSFSSLSWVIAKIIQILFLFLFSFFF